MRMDDVGIKAPACADCANEVRPKEPDERQSRTPRSRNILRHVASVGEFLVATRGISETLNSDSVYLVLGGNAFGGRSNYMHRDTFVA